MATLGEDIRDLRANLSQPSEAAAIRAAVNAGMAGLRAEVDAVAVSARGISDAATVSCGDPKSVATPEGLGILDKQPGMRQAVQRSIDLLGHQSLDAIGRGDFAAGTAIAAERRRIAARFAQVDRDGPAKR